MSKIIIEGRLEHECTDDGGTAKIARLDGPEELYVRVCSYDEFEIHDTYQKLVNRKVRITIEVLEEDL